MGLIESPLLELCHLFILHIVTPVLYTCDVIWVVRLDILDNITSHQTGLVMCHLKSQYI